MPVALISIIRVLIRIIHALISNIYAVFFSLCFVTSQMANQCVRRVPGSFTNVSWALQKILSKFVYCRNRSSYIYIYIYIYIERERERERETVRERQIERERGREREREGERWKKIVFQTTRQFLLPMVSCFHSSGKCYKTRIKSTLNLWIVVNRIKCERFLNSKPIMRRSYILTFFVNYDS